MEVNLASIFLFRIFKYKEIKVMEHMLKQQQLEYWYGVGKNLGLTDEEAVEYAEQQVKDYS